MQTFLFGPSAGDPVIPSSTSASGFGRRCSCGTWHLREPPRYSKKYTWISGLLRDLFDLWHDAKSNNPDLFGCWLAEHRLSIFLHALSVPIAPRQLPMPTKCILTRDILVLSSYYRARLSKDLKAIPTRTRLPVKCRRLNVCTDLGQVLSWL